MLVSFANSGRHDLPEELMETIDSMQIVPANGDWSWKSDTILENIRPWQFQDFQFYTLIFALSKEPSSPMLLSTHAAPWKK